MYERVVQVEGAAAVSEKTFNDENVLFLLLLLLLFLSSNYWLAGHSSHYFGSKQKKGGMGSLFHVLLPATTDLRKFCEK
jgi:hypothetical protein